MKISREARSKYLLEDFEFDEKGNIVFDGNIYKVRKFVQKVNEKKDLINYPELAVKTGHFYGVSLIFEINERIFNLYKAKNNISNLEEELYEYLKKQVGSEKLRNSTLELLQQFPPDSLFKDKIKIEEYLRKKTGDIANEINVLNEFAFLWLGTVNSSFLPYKEFFTSDELEKSTTYKKIVNEIHTFFESKPHFGYKNQSVIEFLKEPSEEFPNSIKNQLNYMIQNWGDLLGDYARKILLALDLIREEEMFRGLGPGKAKIYEYDLAEIENFTPDKDWMPKVVMIAKNTYVWLDQLSKKYKRSITKLHEIPNEDLDQLRNWGFNALWLIGIWERSQASKTIKNWCGNPEAEASAYSLYDYVIAYDLGGYDSLVNLKSRASARGIRLASDMVPNHTGIVSKWIIEHPDWFISLDYPPFPSYSYSGENLSGNPNIGIYIEDKYFSRTDAAVTFKLRTGYRDRYVYHGNDGTSFPWNDTAQLNFLIPEVRETVINTILQVSKMFPIIRFDAAMTLTRKHFQRLWFPQPGTGGAIPSRAEHGISREEFLQKMPKEFWREVVDRINKENPDTLLLAEAFWLLEGFFVRTLGMHRVYNSAFMNMLRDEENANYRAVIKNTLEFDPEILKRFVNFLNNPDEETAAIQFGKGEKYFGICTLMVTMPGLPMFGHGQIEGYSEKYGMEYRRSYWDEKIDEGLLNHHINTIFPIMKKRYLFAEVKNFYMYDFWAGNHVNEDVFAYSNKFFEERALVVYHNKYAETKGFIKNSVGFALKEGEDKLIVQKTLSEGLEVPNEGYCIFKDYMSGLEYIRLNKEISEKGLYLELKAFKTHVFMDFRIIQKDPFFHYAQLYSLLRGNGVHNIENTLQSIIYQPLHEPLRRIINTKMISSIEQVKNNEKILEELHLNLKQLLREARNYSSGKNNPEVIEETILRKGKVALELRGFIKRSSLTEEKKQWIYELYPKNTHEKGILYIWLILHKLGLVKTQKNYEILSRSWVDEWHLNRVIYEFLEEIKEDDIDSWNTISLIKNMVSQQNWHRIISSETERKMPLNYILSIPEIQRYLNINRYHDKLWFNAESFNELTKWLFIVAIIDLFSDTGEYEDESVQNLIKVVKNWRDNAKNSDYQVAKLIDLVKD